MTKLLTAAAFACALLVSGCNTIAPGQSALDVIGDTSATAASVVSGVKTGCGFVISYGDAAAVLASFVPGAASGVTIAQEVCKGLTAKVTVTRFGASRPVVAVINGVSVTGTRAR